MRYSYLAVIINILGTVLLIAILGLGFIIFDRMVLGGRFTDLELRMSQVNAIVARLNKATATAIDLEQQLLSTRTQLSETQATLGALPGYRLNKSLQNYFQGSEVVLIDGRYTFDHVIHFASHSSQLSHKERLYLNMVAQKLKALETASTDFEWILRVEGHTDRQAFKGDGPPPSYWMESYKRALTVVQYLISQGVEPNRLFPAAFSHYHPSNPEKMKENRRVVLRFDFIN